MQGLMIFAAVLVLILLGYYSWTFGVKQRRFCNSWLLASFYCSSVLIILTTIAESIVDITQLSLMNKIEDYYNTKDKNQVYQ